MLTLALFAALLAQGGAWRSLHFLEGDWIAMEVDRASGIRIDHHEIFMR
jgi:hypothetical protein